MWPMKAPSGRKMKKHSRRSDTSMPGGSGKPNYNQHHDSNFINSDRYSVANKDHNGKDHNGKDHEIKLKSSSL